MRSRPSELVHVWRTNGGLYLHSSGRTAKVCTLRDATHNEKDSAPQHGGLSEVIYSRYGKRYRNIHAGEVRAGMVVRVGTPGGSGLQLSLIQEAYAGVKVREIAGDGLFLVFDERRAALVPGNDLTASLPLFEDGWTGVKQPLWALGGGERRTIIRVEQLDNLLSGSARLLEEHPGWEPIIDGLKARLQATSDSAKVTGVWSRSDGNLAVRLDGLPSTDHEQRQAIRDAVHRTERAARETCLQCGAPGSIRTLAGPRGEPFGYALCDECGLGKYMRDEVVFPPPTWTALPEGTAGANVMVEPGWWELLSEFRSLASVIAPVERMFAQQRDGHLQVRIDLPDSVAQETMAQVYQLIFDYEKRAETRCEHCGDPGKLVEAPWRHVCCQECDTYEHEAASEEAGT